MNLKKEGKMKSKENVVNDANEVQRQGIYDARILGVPKMILLGLQHMFSFFGATVLVPLIVGLPIQTTLLSVGLGTWLFHYVTGRKVPAFLGSSFAFLGGYALINASPTFAAMEPYERLAYANGGALIGVVIFYFSLAFAIWVFGEEKVLRFLSPVVTGPIIICIGLTLAPSAISNASSNWLLALITVLVVICFKVWGKGVFKIVPILMGVVIPYGIVLIANCFGVGGSWALDFSSIANAHWLGLPPLIFAEFNMEAVLIMAPICIATMVEHVGDIAAISATIKRDCLKNPGLHRTLVGDALASIFALFFGGPANTTYGENTGVLEMTRVYDPRVIRIAAGYAVVLAFFPKVAAFITAIPTAIIGGVSIILYGMIAAIGIRNLIESHTDLTKSRNLIVVSIILVCGLGMNGGVTFSIGGISITLTGIALAAIVGITTNAILPGDDDYTFGENPETDSND